MLITIPGGQAELRDKPTIGGQQLVQEEALPFGLALRARLGGDPADAEPAAIATVLRDTPDKAMLQAVHGMQRAVIVALLKSWTLQDPLPTMDTIGELDPDVYAALEKQTAHKAMDVMRGVNLSPTLTESGKLDRESPTLPSSDSNGGGPDLPVLSTDPIKTSSDVTESGSFVDSFN